MRINKSLPNKDQIYGILLDINHDFENEIQYDNTGVSSTNDPVLRNIALYISKIYNHFNVLCSIHSYPKEDCKDICKYINKWLNQKKSIYTCDNQCNFNKTLWDKYIEELWNSLVKKDEGIEWCSRDNEVNTNAFPTKMIPNSCYKNAPTEFSISCVDNEVVRIVERVTECPIHDASIDEISTRLSTKSTMIASVGYILFVMVVIVFSFYKFSPVKSNYYRIIERIKGFGKSKNEKEIQCNFKNWGTSQMFSENDNCKLHYNNSVI
ncbi:variable surface protein [Plasmodium gonderi]|uniref:Variable surface protein n=1 Tax=Plasmodium gonderi TaxID=77519 RepID=A0A1Y1JVE5_PLAGO|nr:variable surface protein [Plasmodium gonderi]GAW84353.1 variable surface protein [Plasmodium gonderi]